MSSDHRPPVVRQRVPRRRVEATEQADDGAVTGGHDPHRAIGYGNPPRSGQFRKGMSGNPKGRPRVRKRPSEILDDILNSEIEIREGGRLRRVTAIEAVFRRQVADAMKGDPKATDRLLKCMQVFGAAGAATGAGEAEASPAETALMKEMAGWLKGGGVEDEAGSGSGGGAGDD